MDTGENFSMGKKRFRFEKWWLEKDSFKDIVHKAWACPCIATRSIDMWQFRIRIFRRLTRGWASNEVALMNKIKTALAEEYNSLDLKAENNCLSDI
jgi:hypothetical protein